MKNVDFVGVVTALIISICGVMFVAGIYASIAHMKHMERMAEIEMGCRK